MNERTFKLAPFDFDRRYAVDGWSGIAWEAIEHPIDHAEGDENYQWIEDWGPRDDPDAWGWMGCERFYGETTCTCDPDLGRVVCVMVGDDRRFTHDVDDLTPLDDDDYCSGCGQIGCGHG